MLYAKIVLGIPVEGPFDYIVPEGLSEKIKAGSRVRVSFRTQQAVGYVVKLTKKSNINNVKPILALIDEVPILDKNILSLTKGLSEYYCCSWGEAIETALPEVLRKGRKISQNINIIEETSIRYDFRPEVTLLHDLDGDARWEIYLKSIKEALDSNRSIIVLLPDISSVLRAKEKIYAHLGIIPALLYRKQPQELSEWLKLKSGQAKIVVGTRSSIFAPLNNLGLVIIDEEHDPVYKQDQVPHYHAREVAYIRIKIEKAKLILGSGRPSLETFYSAKQDKIKYKFISRIKDFLQIKIIDTGYLDKISKQKNIFLSKYLEDSIAHTLNAQGKILLFLNRKGFATLASCISCGKSLRCPRCNVNLVYHFKDNILNCHYCNFKMQPPQICPNCNSGYIKYSGLGTEKIESELSRLFPQVRIKSLDSRKQIDFSDIDIFVSTQAIIKDPDCSFDLVGVLAIDNSLNRIDFRASEKTFALLIGLLKLTGKKMIIQTRLPGHSCFQALEKKDMDIFYAEELRQRKALKFPPYGHLGLIKLRGIKEERVKEASSSLFDRLNRFKKRNIKILSVNSGQPAKLRGNFYWQILIRGKEPRNLSSFLKNHLKDFPHSGIIVTVDIDPV